MSKEKPSTYLVHKYMVSSALGWVRLILVSWSCICLTHGGSTGDCVVYDGLTWAGSSLCFLLQQASKIYSRYGHRNLENKGKCARLLKSLTWKYHTITFTADYCPNQLIRSAQNQGVGK